MAAELEQGASPGRVALALRATTMEGVMERPSHPFARGMLLGALLLAAIANVAELRVTDRHLGTTYAAVNRYSSDDLAQVIAEHSPTVRERFQLYLEVRRWAHGADLALSPDTGLIIEQLVGLGGIGRISGWDGQLELSDEMARHIEGHVVAEGEDRVAGPFAIAVLPQNADRLIAIQDGSRLLLIDERLLDEVEV